VQRFNLLHLLVLLAVCAATTACEKVALTAPTGSTLTIVLSSTTVPINGSVEVIATVIEAGGTAAHNGTMVTFAAAFGRLEPSEAPTSGGRAIVRFIGTSSGTTKITALSGSARVESGDLKVGAAATERVTVRTEPTSIPAAGGTVTVIASTLDGAGNALPNTPVSFTVDNGSLSSSSATTDANGEARITLTTTRASKITAASGTKTGEFTVSVLLAPTVAISTAATNPSVGVPITFTVTPTVPAGGSPIGDISVNFGDGTVRSLGAPTGATAAVHTFTTPGVYTVTATVTDAVGQSNTSTTAVSVQRLQPTVGLTLNPTSITAGGTTTATVTATAATGGPPLSNVTITQGGVQIYSGSGGGSALRQFTTAGTYTFQATATDTAGTQSTTTATLVVTGRSAIEMTLDASTSGGAAATCSSAYPKTCTGFTAGNQVIFNAGFVGTAPSNITGYSWNFGDGSTATTTNRNTDHKFTVAGSYTVTVTVTTADGNSGSQVVTVIVS